MNVYAMNLLKVFSGIRNFGNYEMNSSFQKFSTWTKIEDEESRYTRAL